MFMVIYHTTNTVLEQMSTFTENFSLFVFGNVTISVIKANVKGVLHHNISYYITENAPRVDFDLRKILYHKLLLASKVYYEVPSLINYNLVSNLTLCLIATTAEVTRALNNPEIKQILFNNIQLPVEYAVSVFPLVYQFISSHQLLIEDTILHMFKPTNYIDFPHLNRLASSIQNEISFRAVEGVPVNLDTVLNTVAMTNDMSQQFGSLLIELKDNRIGWVQFHKTKDRYYIAELLRTQPEYRENFLKRGVLQGLFRESFNKNNML